MEHVCPSVEKREGSSDSAVLLSFVGLIPADDLQKMSEAIALGCERKSV